MDIGVPLKDLGDVDVGPLRDAILLWMIKLGLIIVIARQPTTFIRRLNHWSCCLWILTHWPKFEVTREAAWDMLSDTAMPIMNAILEQFYPPGGQVIRAMAAKLVSGGVITPH